MRAEHERVVYNRLVMHDVSLPVPAARVFMTSVKKSGLTPEQVNKLVMSSAKRKKQLMLPIYEPPRWFQIVAKIEATCTHREALDATNVILTKLLALIKGGYSVEDAYDKVVCDFPGHVQRGVLYQHRSLPFKRTITRFDRTSLMWSESDDLAFSDGAKRGGEHSNLQSSKGDVPNTKGEPPKVATTAPLNEAAKTAAVPTRSPKEQNAQVEVSAASQKNGTPNANKSKTVVPNPLHKRSPKKTAKADFSAVTKKVTPSANKSNTVVPKPLHNRSLREKNAQAEKSAVRKKGTPYAKKSKAVVPNPMYNRSPKGKKPGKKGGPKKTARQSPLASPRRATPSPPSTPDLRANRGCASSEGEDGQWSDEKEEVSL